MKTNNHPNRTMKVTNRLLCLAGAALLAAQFTSTARAQAVLSQQAYLKASDSRADLGFGFRTAVSGNTMVVGSSSAAYVFVRDGDNWTQQAILTASNQESGDGFGEAVAISGDTVVVGASNEDSSATGVDGDGFDNSAKNSGAAYVFVRNGTSWSQQAYLKASNTGGTSDNTVLGDLFGAAVAIDGDTLVIGSYQEASAATGVNGDQSDDSAFAAGAAYVFVRSGTTWTQQAYLKASNTSEFSSFGNAVAISGNTIVIGAPGEQSNARGVNGDQQDKSAPYSGAAYVFVRDGTNWTQEAYLKASNAAPGQWFGRFVAISGNTIVVGSPSESSAATGVNGDQNNTSASGAGAAYVFVRNGASWNQQAYLKASNTDGPLLDGCGGPGQPPCQLNGDLFGFSVAAADNLVVVGARYEQSGATGINGNQSNNSAPFAGAAYVFLRQGTNWSQQAYVKASNTDAGDDFAAVAISGNTIVVGASREASAATGVNGNQSDNSAYGAGAAYVFNVTMPPQLNIKKLGNNVVLSWTNAAFGLHSALAIGGTFTNIPRATSPYTNPISGAQRFFRLVQ